MDQIKPRRNENGRIFISPFAHVPSPAYLGGARVDSIQKQTQYGMQRGNHIANTTPEIVTGSVTARAVADNMLHTAAMNGDELVFDLLLAYGDPCDIVDLSTVTNATVLEDALITGYQAAMPTSMSSAERFTLDETFSFGAGRMTQVALPTNPPLVASPGTGALVAATQYDGEFYFIEADLSGANHVLTLHYTISGNWVSKALGTFAAMARYTMDAGNQKLYYTTNTTVYSLALADLATHADSAPRAVVPPNTAYGAVVTLGASDEGILIFLADGSVWIADALGPARVLRPALSAITNAGSVPTAQAFWQVGSAGIFTTDRYGRRRKTTLPAGVTYNLVVDIRMSEDGKGMLLAASTGTLYESSDRGVTWRTVYAFGSTLRSIVHAGRFISYAAVAAASGNELWASVCGGRQWKRMPHNTGVYEILGMHALKDGGVVAVGRKGTGGVQATGVSPATFLLSTTKQAIA